MDQLTSPREKFAAKPHIAGTKGGHTLNLHRFASDGVTLLGRVAELDGNVAGLARDLHKNLAAGDRFELNLTAKIVCYIGKHGLVAPQEILPTLTKGFEQPERDELDLMQSNVPT